MCRTFLGKRLKCRACTSEAFIIQLSHIIQPSWKREVYSDSSEWWALWDKIVFLRARGVVCLNETTAAITTSPTNKPGKATWWSPSSSLVGKLYLDVQSGYFLLISGRGQEVAHLGFQRIIYLHIYVIAGGLLLVIRVHTREMKTRSWDEGQKGCFSLWAAVLAPLPHKL